MTDLTAEQRADLKAKAEAANGALGYMTVDAPVVLALLAEIDRLRDVEEAARRTDAAYYDHGFPRTHENAARWDLRLRLAALREGKTA